MSVCGWTTNEAHFTAYPWTPLHDNANITWGWVEDEYGYKPILSIKAHKFNTVP